MTTMMDPKLERLVEEEESQVYNEDEFEEKVVIGDEAELPFTDEELSAFRATKALLINEHKMPENLISSRELIIITMNCKLRPVTAAEKYKRWLDCISTGMGVTSFQSAWEEIGRSGENLPGHRMADNMTKTFAGCGCDIMKRSVMWILTSPIPVDEEADAMKCSIVYFTAIHADMRSLRHGITFILDTSKNSMTKIIGNETKLQKTWQSIPMRPQRIFILGSNVFQRVALNALFLIASLFTKEKIRQRILWATPDDVKAEISQESLPVFYDGEGGGIKTGEDHIRWVQDRLKNFPAFPEI